MSLFSSRIARVCAPALCGVMALSVQGTSRPTPVIPGRYIVVLKRGHAAAEVARTHGLKTGHTFSFAINGFSAAIPENRLRNLQTDPRVDWMEPDMMVSSFEQAVPTGVSRVGALTSPLARIDGVDERVDVDIAIIDSGIDATHPDLNVVSAVTFVTDGSGTQDLFGHGTHVAGTAAALDNDIGCVGVAPGGRLWSVKVLDQYGGGSLSTVIKGVDYVAQNAARIAVANLSLGVTGSSRTLRQSIQNCVARGVVVVAAAGNSGKDVYGTDGVFNTSDDVIPAAYPEVITVSAMNDYDGLPGALGKTGYSGPDDTMANYSNFGTKVDLAAPGTYVYSTLPVAKGSYGLKNGTSMAAPHVAGAAALYIAAYGRAVDATGVEAIRRALIYIGDPQSAWGAPVVGDRDSYPEKLVSAPDSALPAPEVNILSPTPGTVTSPSVVMQGQALAGATDLSPYISWYSSIDGFLATGASVTRLLSPGSHTLTAAVTDPQGRTSKASTSVQVQSSTQIEVFVGTDKPAYLNREKVTILASVTSANAPAGGVSVAASVVSPTGSSKTLSGTTGANGVAVLTYQVNSKSGGTGTYGIKCTVSHGGASASDSVSFLVK